MKSRLRHAVVPLHVLSLGLATALAAQSPDDAVGDWRGELQVQGTTLPVVFHVSRTDSGLSATMDSPAPGKVEVQR